ncbi:L,D-transpeptidase [Methylocapsa palsarum]|uniref:L,D-transpeptidase catalytic domain n=1 Tax=Methylocapsa palsarum TaxID=1612308 RepID=A0A1I4A6W0_9HYPH|nr:L,D-transpeptidase [Methylocapsa palsarum]SFK51586.1 L,D-transpeptidase catalytic domain [Methylocapsa palsarum]
MRKLVFLIACAHASVHAAFAPPANAKVIISVDLDAQEMTVTKANGDSLVWKVSSGREGFETPTGSFTVQRMDANHFSDEYDQSPMPYSIFFSQGAAIHGSSHGGLGRAASHGCIRLSVPHARLLYSWVERYGATIEISGAASQTANIDRDDDGGRAPKHRRRKRRFYSPFGSPSESPWETDYSPQ